MISVKAIFKRGFSMEDLFDFVSSLDVSFPHMEYGSDTYQRKFQKNVIAELIKIFPKISHCKPEDTLGVIDWMFLNFKDRINFRISDCKDQIKVYRNTLSWLDNINKLVRFCPIDTDKLKEYIDSTKK